MARSIGSRKLAAGSIASRRDSFSEARLARTDRGSAALTAATAAMSILWI
jgi:hypothetical protein